MQRIKKWEIKFSISQFNWCKNQTLKHESLILAQDERWRRA